MPKNDLTPEQIDDLKDLLVERMVDNNVKRFSCYLIQRRGNPKICHYPDDLKIYQTKNF